MTTLNPLNDRIPAPSASSTPDVAGNVLTQFRRLIGGGRVGVLRELDDFMLRDIGASGDDIWHVHRLRNGERPTLQVG